jgi:hypothetical protein
MIEASFPTVPGGAATQEMFARRVYPLAQCQSRVFFLRGGVMLAGYFRPKIRERTLGVGATLDITAKRPPMR